MKDTPNPYRYCRAKETPKASARFSTLNREFTAEANVDNEIVTSRSTLKVVKEEVINGKRYKVLTVG